MCVCLLHCDRSSHSMGHINNRNKYKCIVELQQLLVVVVHYYTGRLFQVKWSCLTERSISQVTLIVDASSLTHIYCLLAAPLRSAASGAFGAMGALCARRLRRL